MNRILPPFSGRLTAALFAAQLLAAPAFAASGTVQGLHFVTGAFDVQLEAGSQTLISLKPKAGKDFDFTPSDRYAQRKRDGYYRLGDLDVRLRTAGETAWHDYSTALHRVPVKPLKHAPGVLAAADLTATLPSDIPLHIERRWTGEKGGLALTFTLTNRSDQAVEIGGLGLPMIFNNIIDDRTLAQAHEQASFADPYVGRDGGYLQVTRLNGKGPALLVLPQASTPFELYKPILDATGPDKQLVIYNDPQKRSATFEGFYDWMVAAKGFADTDWKGVQQWNSPTSFTLAPGETRVVGVRFVLAPAIRQIETTLMANDRPVAVGIPGYVLPTDMDGSLFVHAPKTVASVTVFPEGALDVSAPSAAAKPGWVRFTIKGVQWGRARLDLHYSDGTDQSVHYFVTKPEPETVADLGHFLNTTSWYDNPDDPFHRGPSPISYDHDAGAQVTQDHRVWIAGLSDEGGAGSWVADIMKQYAEPDPAEVAKFEDFATHVLDGRLQVDSGPDMYGVRKSLFSYDPKAQPAGTYDPAQDWTSWASWSPEKAASVGRSYNYPHVAAAWWVLYHLARDHQGLVRQHDWHWYLDRAYRTAVAMQRLAPEYAQFGQMEGDVFVSILDDLKAEGMTAEAADLEGVMKARADHWRIEAYPFGSEMPWDPTGQAEVYAWMRYFGYADKAAATREVILGYDPLIPHWGYNGSARRFWDFLYAGKTMRVERQLHHYGSSLNAVPLFDAYRQNPKDIHLLRVAYGGLMGSLTNIGPDGFGSAAFHSFPDRMAFDGYSGDYGMSFFGHAYADASYLVDDPTFGWIGFGGNVAQTPGLIAITPKDAARQRVFIAPAGLWLTLDAGHFDKVTYDPTSGKVTLTLAPADAYTPQALLKAATTVTGARPYRLARPTALQRGLYVLDLETGATTSDLVRAP